MSPHGNRMHFPCSSGEIRRIGKCILFRTINLDGESPHLKETENNRPLSPGKDVEMERIAVYGTGTIGSCEATLITGHGVPCVVVGHSEQGLECCRRTIAENWDDLLRKWTMPE